MCGNDVLSFFGSEYGMLLPVTCVTSYIYNEIMWNVWEFLYNNTNWHNP